MTRPRRDELEGRIYLDLRALARRMNRPTDEVFVLYILERFLYRLSRSEHRDAMLLKGGMLLAALHERRPTRDVDLLALDTDNDAATIAAIIRDILAIDAGDGVTFETAALATSTIREDGLYTGIRVRVPASLQRARHPLRVDINVGDPVRPGPVEVSYPALLAEPFSLRGYPVETVLAEKIVTMIERGPTTTRERDFADVLTLIQRHDIEAQRLHDAIAATAEHRGARLRPLAEALTSLGSRRQPDWQAYLARAGIGGVLPASYTDAITAVSAFADPLLTDLVSRGTWNASARAWTPSRDGNEPERSGQLA